MLKHKLSIDFKKENFDRVKYYADNRSTSTSNVVNLLIEIMFGLGRDTRKRLLRTLHFLKNELYTASDDCELYYEEKKDYDLNALSKMMDILNFGIDYEPENTMKKIVIKSGACIIPNEWIVLSNLMTEDRIYPGIIEIRNAEHYGNPPHILFFSKEPINHISKEEEEIVLSEAEREVPIFTNIRTMQVKPLYDDNNVMLNYDLYIKAPIIGLFELYDSKSAFTDFPFGAMFLTNE